MLENILLGLTAMLACLLVQASLVSISFVFYTRNLELADSPNFRSTFFLMSGIMVTLVVGTFVQIGIWAVFFMRLDEFADYSTALYHSAVNFSTLGYGDIVMSEAHRILGPMESINGVLMIGVSTAVMMSALQDAMKRTRAARREQGLLLHERPKEP